MCKHTGTKGAWIKLLLALVIASGWLSAAVTVKASDIKLDRNLVVNDVEFVNENLPKRDFASCQKSIMKGISLVPTEHLEELDTVILHNDASRRRGLANYNTIYIRCNIPEPELIAVFIHEMGHIVDLSYLISKEENEKTNMGFSQFPVFRFDTSLDYYLLSWKNCSEKASQTVRRNFVSEYAMTNCYEDFAETYAYYLLHQSDFEQIKNDNPVIFSKFYFLRNLVFKQESNSTTENLDIFYKNKLTKEVKEFILSTSLDVTKLAYKPTFNETQTESLQTKISLR